MNMYAIGGKNIAATVVDSSVHDISKTQDEVKKNMRGAIANYIKVLGGMRPGQANAGIFDNLMISAYGQVVPLPQLGQVSVVNSTELAVTVYNASVVVIVIYIYIYSRGGKRDESFIRHRS
jgi:hypothetical protein